jgi:hypothetical protein
MIYVEHWIPVISSTVPITNSPHSQVHELTRYEGCRKQYNLIVLYI